MAKGFVLTLRRLALNMNQIERYRSPANPAKETDTRFQGYLRQFGPECWEIDALDPAVTDALIETEIAGLIDRDAWNSALAQAAAHRAWLEQAALRWGAMSKLAVRCVDWRKLSKNTLRGFAAVQIAEMRMTTREVAVHEKGEKTWAQAPIRPWIKDGALVTDGDGRPTYSPLIEFDADPVRHVFSDAVVNAVLARDPHALACQEEVA